MPAWLEGAIAYPVGDIDKGLKQMLEQVNRSRLSHGVRAAAMMRRCWNESLRAARTRIAFGRAIAEFPLLRRQLMKILVPTEQALSVSMFTGRQLELAECLVRFHSRQQTGKSDRHFDRAIAAARKAHRAWPENTQALPESAPT